MKHDTEQEIETLVSHLRHNAMQDLIARRIGAVVDAPAPHAHCPSQAQPNGHDRKLRKFIRRWYRGKPRKPTEEEMDQIVASVEKQMERAPKRGFYPLDFSLPKNQLSQ